MNRAVLVLLLVGTVLVGVWYTWNQSNEPAAAEDAEQVEPVAEEQVTKNNVYRNEEWGFQFEYPNGWDVQDPVSRNKAGLLNIGLWSKNHDSFFPVRVFISEKVWGDRLQEKFEAEREIGEKNG